MFTLKKARSISRRNRSNNNIMSFKREPTGNMQHHFLPSSVRRNELNLFLFKYVFYIFNHNLDDFTKVESPIIFFTLTDDLVHY